MNTSTLHSAVLLIDSGRLPGAGPPMSGALGRSASPGGNAARRDALTTLGAGLQRALPNGWAVRTARLHGRPDIASVLEGVVRDGVERLVLLPTHPHFSPTTTGAVMREVYRVLGRRGPHLNVSVCTTWYDDNAYVSALARLIADHASQHDRWPDDTHLRFVAPLLPAPTEGEEGGGDSYRRQVQRTAELVAERVGWPMDRLSVVFDSPQPQSRLHPARQRSGTEGEGGELLLCRLPFPDPTHPPLVSCLKNIVLHGPKPVQGTARGRPLLRRSSEAAYCAGEPASLVMVGASVASHLRGGRGPRLRYSTPEAFSHTKRSRAQLRATLQWMQEQTPAYEAFIWNTCQRVEAYAWLPRPSDPAEYDGLVCRIRGELFGCEPDGLEVNVLWGSEARHHLLRTACGLNSDLPGDRDVSAQLETAARIARCTASVGPRATTMVEDAMALADDVRARTTWGRFSAGYCEAALARVGEEEARPLDRLHHVVIGGSTTSRSVLAALAERHHVPHRQMTVVYRDHHGQMKQLRCAVGCGTRLRVHSYSEERVLQSIVAADLVYMGIDRPEPVLDVDVLRDLRDFGDRPLTIVDFNSFGSIAGAPLPEGVTLWTSEGLDHALSAHAAITTSQVGFAGALAEAEEWILAHMAAARPVLAALSAEGG